MKLKRLSVLFFATFVAVLALWSCQPDTPAANTNAGGNGELSAPANTQAADAPEDQVQIKAAALARAKELEQQSGAFLIKIHQLRKQVNAVPRAKQIATDFDELEARLDGYMEKGAYVQEELRQLIQQITDTGFNDLGAAKLEEETSNLAGFQAGMVILEKAVDKLKNAKGSNTIQLFEE